MRFNGSVSFNNAATLKTKYIASPNKCYIMNVNTKSVKGVEAAFHYSQSEKRGLLLKSSCVTVEAA